MKSAAPAKSKLARWRARLLAIGLSFGVGAGLAEWIVRVNIGRPIPERRPLLRVEAHPTRGWQMIAGEDHYTYEHLVEINALGLRGSELPEMKSVGETRVLALGDSMIYGQGVADEDTLPAQLQSALQARAVAGTSWRVINAGLRAYATNQELALLDELGRRIDPDVVILFWYDNDFGEKDLAETYAELLPKGPVTFDVGAPLRGWTLWSWKLRDVVRHSALVMFVQDWVRDSLYEEPDDAYFEKGFQKLDEHLQRFRDTCVAEGWRPILAVVPMANTILNEVPASGRARKVQEAARRAGVQVIDLLPALVQLLEDQGSFPTLPYDGHYRGSANERMAVPLAEALTAPWPR